MKGKKKYRLGTGKRGVVRTYIDNPKDDLIQNEINIVKSQNEAANNPLVKGLNILGGFAIEESSMIGSNIGSGGMAKYGGVSGGVPVEVEDDEAAQLPNGDLINFEGADHSQGGIDTNLPKGTKIYSEKIKIDGESMADRKNRRVKSASKFKKMVDDNKYDILATNSLKATEKSNKIQDDLDMDLQESIRQALDKSTEDIKKYKYGTDGVGEDGYDELDPYGIKNFFFNPKRQQGGREYGTGNPAPMNTLGASSSSEPDLKGELRDPMSYELPGYEDPVNNNKNSFKDPNIHLGDIVGLAGNMVSTFGPMNNTKKNRAGDTPNINPYEGYGEDGLARLENSKDLLASNRDNQFADLKVAQNSLNSRNRNSARGVNTMRALDIASHSQTLKSTRAINNDYNTGLANINSQQAQFENQQDRMVMHGKGQKDMADRYDRDNYYSQLAQDISTQGTGLQQTGKDLNSMEQNKMMENLLNQLSKYGLVLDRSGNIVNGE